MPPVRGRKDPRVKRELRAKAELLDLLGRWGRLGHPGLKAIRDLRVRLDRQVRLAAQGSAS